MIVGITMQQPTGVATTPHEVPGDKEEGLPVENEGRLKLPPSSVYPHDSAQENPEMHAMPPQQVFVSAAMPGIPPAAGISGLENQFQSLGFKQEDSIGTDQLTNSGPNSESNNLDNLEEPEHEGEESEDEPVKLFVGQVRSMQCSECVVASLLSE